MANENTVDVCIPAYRPDKKFYKLLLMLSKQKLLPKKVFIANTENGDPSFDSEALLININEYFEKNGTDECRNLDIEIIPVAKKDFDHGGTRDMVARRSDADFILFITQDAVPENRHLISEMVRMMSTEDIGACYARQKARNNASVIETYTRLYNYPAKSAVHTAEDVNRIGIKAFFCSDTCAMYRRATYLDYGGFTKKTIFNEDMIFAGNFILAGGAVGYCAEASVIHSHNYDWIEQFKRNFDLGVSQADHPEVFSVVKAENEGVKYAKKLCRYLWDNRYYLEIIDFTGECIFRYLGFLLGKKYKLLPKKLILSFTLNKAYWEK